MALFLARFLGLRLVVVDPGFISRNIKAFLKVPGRHQHVLSLLQSAGVAPTLQTLYGIAEHYGRYGVLIHHSYPDVRLFHALLRGDCP